MIYFDNAATSYPKPPVVIKKVNEAMRCAGNPGRGLHGPAVWASQEVYKTRTKLSTLFNIDDPMRIAFLHNATAALNNAVNLCKAKILTTSMEHNSVLRPLYKRGYYDIIKAEPNGDVLPEKVISKISDTTGAVIMTHASNVTGNIYDIGTVGRFCRKKGIIFIVDASQTAGIVPIDVESMCIDVLCFTGHKSLFGVQGTGGIYVSPELNDRISPLICGGTGTDSLLLKHPTEMPEAFEAGTVNVHGISALGAGVDYITSFKEGEIFSHEQVLKKKIIDELSANNRVTIYGGAPEKSVGIVSFNLKGYESQEIADILAEKEICVRGGFHCAPLAHRTIGTYNTGTVRISLGISNTYDEVIKVCKVINNL